MKDRAFPASKALIAFCPFRAVLQTFHHPYFVDGHSEIQNQMGAYMKSWIEQQSANDKQFILKGLTKDAVRNHKNKRRGHESDQEGHGAHGRGSRSRRGFPFKVRS